MINEDNAKLLALYGIELKNETSSHSIIRLKNNDYDSKISSPLYKKLLYSIRECNLSSTRIYDVVFGVELEFIGDDNTDALREFNQAMVDLLKTNYIFHGSYTHNDGSFWILGKDSSIKCDRLNHEFGYELSSPKLNLSSESDIALLKTVIDYVKTYLHGRVNDSCGTHVHISMPYPCDNSHSDVCSLLKTYSCIEEIVFDPLVPSNRRRNTYCKPTSPGICEKYQKLSARYSRFDRLTRLCHELRFESRQLEGTLDLHTILNWTALQSYVIRDMIDNSNDKAYVENALFPLDAISILFRYDFSSDLISFFLDRIKKIIVILQIVYIKF